MTFRALMVTAAVSALLTAPAVAETLRIQSLYAPETISGRMIAQFVDDIHIMSGGDLQIEMFYSSSVVKSVETFDVYGHLFDNAEDDVDLFAKLEADLEAA